MRILFVSSEIEPLAKVGGLADVVGALPAILKKLGCDVRVVIPYYKCVKESARKLRLNFSYAAKVINVIINGRPIAGRIIETELDNVKIYMLSCDELYNRDHIYSSPDGDYKDNDTRFGFLSLGALEVCKSSRFKPDVIHCHDWHTALIPILLRQSKYYKYDGFFSKTKTVFTIHNIAHQGVYERDILDKFSLPVQLFNINDMEFYGKVNLMKGAIIYSDLVTTVSPKYMEEIKTPQYGYGLDGVLRSISNNSNNRLYGILNGIDYGKLDPDNDKNIFVNFNERDVYNKIKNKIYLKKEIGLRDDNKKPLIGMVTRLAEQKGIDLVLDSLAEILELGYQLVVLGSGDKKYENVLKNTMLKYGGDFSFIHNTGQKMPRKIYAASDMFLMPSRFEPCGLGQLIALRYGCIPIVRATGGLLNTIKDYSTNKDLGNGFIFYGFTKSGLLNALGNALKVYRYMGEWELLVKKAMRCNFSWDISGKIYLNLYSYLNHNTAGIAGEIDEHTSNQNHIPEAQIGYWN